MLPLPVSQLPYTGHELWTAVLSTVLLVVNEDIYGCTILLSTLVHERALPRACAQNKRDPKRDMSNMPAFSTHPDRMNGLGYNKFDPICTNYSRFISKTLSDLQATKLNTLTCNFKYLSLY